jgi:DNA-binding PadR family transcriptional regulator
MLRKQPKSGYDLNKELKFVVHYFWETDLSRIYRTLNDLQNKGWVEFQTIVQDGSPNKKVYSITDEGRQELRRWLAEPGKSSQETTRNPFLAQLHFSDAIPPDVQQRVMVERLKTLQEEVSELERRARSLNMPVPLLLNMVFGVITSRSSGRKTSSESSNKGWKQNLVTQTDFLNGRLMLIPCRNVCTKGAVPLPNHLLYWLKRNR